MKGSLKDWQNGRITNAGSVLHFSILPFFYFAHV